MLTWWSFINRKETEQYAAIAAEYLSSIAGKVLAKIMLGRLVEHISEGVLNQIHKRHVFCLEAAPGEER